MVKMDSLNGQNLLQITWQNITWRYLKCWTSEKLFFWHQNMYLLTDFRHPKKSSKRTLLMVKIYFRCLSCHSKILPEGILSVWHQKNCFFDIKTSVFRLIFDGLKKSSKWTLLMVKIHFKWLLWHGKILHKGRLDIGHQKNCFFDIKKCV